MRELVNLTCLAWWRMAYSAGMDKGNSISKVHQILVAAFSLFLGILLARAMGF